MDTVTLKYGVGETSQVFDVYSFHDYNTDLQQKLDKKLDFGYVEDVLGGRRRISVEFAPIENDRTLLAYLKAFCSSSIKKVNDYTVALDGDNLDFDYLNDISFADSFKLNFVEVDLTLNTDDGSTMTLVPTYAIDDSTAGTYNCLLFDEQSVLVGKHRLDFLSRSKLKDLNFGYMHKVTLNLRPLNPLVDLDKITWLKNFCQWKNKVIDASQISSANNYNVVYSEPKINFEFINASLKTTLTFYENTLRTQPEVFDGMVWGDNWGEKVWQ